MTDDELPPPYAARDPGPANAHSRTPEVPSFSEATNSSADPIVSPTSIGQLVQSVVLRLENLEQSVPQASGHQYFRIRPPKTPKPVGYIVHAITIQPTSGPESFKHAGPTFRERDVNEYDWMTFLNYLFIEDTLNSLPNQGPIVTEKGRPIRSHSGPSSSRSAQLTRLIPKTATADAERRTKFTATIEEWNKGFFQPRGIRVRAVTVRSPNLIPSTAQDIDAKPAGGDTALYKAVKLGDLETTRLLLSKGADPNKHSAGTKPALWAACNKACDNPGFFWTTKGSAAHREIMYLLLAHGADIDAKPAGEGSVTHLFAKRKETKLVSELIRWGADVDRKPICAASALYEAVQKGDLEMAHMLIDAGADLQDTPAGCESMLQVAVNRRRRDVLELLLENGAEVEGREPGAYGTPVYTAVDRGDVPVLRILLSRGADPNKTAQGRAPPLHCAVQKSDTECAETLLEWGADPMKTSAGREAPLALAVGKGLTGLVKLMLKASGDTTDQDRQQEMEDVVRKAAADSGLSTKDLLQ